MEEYNLKYLSLEGVVAMLKCYVGSYRAVRGMDVCKLINIRKLGGKWGTRFGPCLDLI
jgi:hypothetical protein